MATDRQIPAESEMLEEIAVLNAAAREAAAVARAAMDRRNDAIRAAYGAGVSPNRIAVRCGLERQGVYRVAKAAHDSPA